MRSKFIGIALFGFLSASVFAQGPFNPQAPPSKDQLPDLVPPVPRAPWAGEQRDGAFLEASAPLTIPYTNLPIEGVGLPGDAEEDPREEVKVPCLRPMPYPAFQRSGRIVRLTNVRRPGDEEPVLCTDHRADPNWQNAHPFCRLRSGKTDSQIPARLQRAILRQPANKARAVFSIALHGDGSSLIIVSE